MFYPYPISFLQFALFWPVVAVGGMAPRRAFAGSSGDEKAAKRSGLSTLGIALQAIGFGVTGFGPIHFALPWSAPSSLICSTLVALLGGSAIAVFIAATRAMGKNWRRCRATRSDHQLVQSGPFAVVRHPIYLALFLLLLSFGIAFGHFGQLLVAAPFYLVGAIIRIRIEEKLLGISSETSTRATCARCLPSFPSSAELDLLSRVAGLVLGSIDTDRILATFDHVAIDMDLVELHPSTAGRTWCPAICLRGSTATRARPSFGRSP